MTHQDHNQRLKPVRVREELLTKALGIVVQLIVKSVYLEPFTGSHAHLVKHFMEALGD